MKGELYMKLNEKGKAISAKWTEIWQKTVEEDIAERGDKYEGGWSVMFERGKVLNADDFIGVLLAAYGDDAFDYVDDVCYGNGFCAADEFDFGVSFGEYKERMSVYFEPTADDYYDVDYEEPFFTSLNPWDAPGMKLSDFL